eukprot:CAMPEP_0181331394 /NCGR_PEP_ID=MMETSP1101-20121128/24472_1 /TAXON_ID=46948 /ORGANISM="Rhodomonas abbreviata, Strain Caron Lab Isolate" /LENGTH=116 /DNA_ID=CAMNT_0023440839 /DNA_START=219 /DNA_END=569 /DNA_ORIENTATION=+
MSGPAGGSKQLPKLELTVEEIPYLRSVLSEELGYVESEQLEDEAELSSKRAVKDQLDNGYLQLTYHQGATLAQTIAEHIEYMEEEGDDQGWRAAQLEMWEKFEERLDAYVETLEKL